MVRRRRPRRPPEHLRVVGEPPPAAPGADDPPGGYASAGLRARGEARRPGLVPPAPLRDDEVICRSCRLAVRRGDLGDAVLLVCADCQH